MTKMILVFRTFLKLIQEKKNRVQEFEGQKFIKYSIFNEKALISLKDIERRRRC